MKSSLTLFLSLSILLLSTQASFLVLKGTNLNTESIHQNNVADLISHVAGIPPLHEGVDRTNFPDVDLFSMPKANLFVAIDGFTSDIIDRFSGELEFFTTKNAVTIEREAYPSDSLAFLTSVVTGESHTEHGIIGKSWQSNGVLAVRAYTPSGQCRTSKIADAVSVGSNGAARTVAFSGTKEMALALGVHSEIAKNHTKWNNQVLHFAHKRGIVSAISDRTVFPSRSAAEFAGTINVSHQSKEGFQFITELFGIENIPQVLKSMTRGDTTLPDFIAVGISGIQAMAQKYGENSAELKAAVEKLDYALAKLSRALNKMYNNKVITQIVGAEYLGEHTTKTQARQMAKMVNPAIELDEMPNLGSYSYQDVTEFQTSFWVALVLIIAFTVVIITLMKMDMLYDSIVYRTTDGPKPIQDVK